MTYEVKLTDTAIGQLKDTVEYISKGLLEPQVARKWSDRIMKSILSLEFMPLRFPTVDEEPWRTEGIHKMKIENFIVYYWVDDNALTVWVTAVVYGRKDQLAILRNMPRE